ncbi:MAG: tyrosine-type recombinase/integrase [Desulfobacteraceae bacterium]|nr:tyrosine-type recombinase/integrase [Desulfobacteraceae bacterium]
MNENSINPWIDEYLTSLKVRNFAKRTVTEIRRKLGKFTLYLENQGVIHIDHITNKTILTYQGELYHTLNTKGRPNTASHQNNMLVAVKQFTRFLYERGYLVSDPSRGIPYAKEPQRLPRSVLTPTEAKKIIHTPDTTSAIGYRDRTILEVLYTTGIRKEEVNNLTIHDVDYTQGILRILEGKGRKDRIVPIGKIACRYLENYITSVRPELIKDPVNSHLFLSLRGNRLSKNMVWKLVKKYAKKAKIRKNVHPHTFRHTCATTMLKNKADINTVRKLLGHESLATTQIYAHLTITDLKDVHKRCHPREKDKQ